VKKIVLRKQKLHLFTNQINMLGVLLAKWCHNLKRCQKAYGPNGCVRIARHPRGVIFFGARNRKNTCRVTVNILHFSVPHKHRFRKHSRNFGGLLPQVIRVGKVDVCHGLIIACVSKLPKNTLIDFFGFLC